MPATPKTNNTCRPPRRPTLIPRQPTRFVLVLSLDSASLLYRTALLFDSFVIIVLYSCELRLIVLYSSELRMRNLLSGLYVLRRFRSASSYSQMHADHT
jgi:hypothetical protein